MSRATLLWLAGIMTAALSGCGPTQSEREAQERARLELEEKAQHEVQLGNKAITDMNKKAFRKRTSEEQAKYEAERAEQARKLIEAQKKADADAANQKP